MNSHHTSDTHHLPLVRILACVPLLAFGACGGGSGQFAESLSDNQAAVVGVTGGASLLPVQGGSTITNTQHAPHTDNVLDHAGRFDALTDFSELINNGLSSKNTLRLPKIHQDYLISKTLMLAEGSTLECDPDVRIVSSATTMFFRTKGANTTIKNCIFEYKGNSKSSVGLVDQPNFTWNGGGSKKANGLAISGVSAKFAKIMNTHHFDSTSTAISLVNGASNNSIIHNEMQRSKGFGVWVTLGANNNLIEGNITYQNGIELVGITSTAFNNKVINNSAKNTGDNCFSITGTGNTVIGNYGQNCGFSGLYLYGSRNTAVANFINGAGGVQDPQHPYYQASNKQKYGAITVSGGWSGAGQFNSIIGNHVSDERAEKTTSYGIKIGSGYPAFQVDMPISSGNYIYNATNIYQALDSGKTGPAAPTCTMGTCSDGAIQWKWVNKSEEDSAEPVGNVISGNIISDLAEAYADFSKNKNNQLQRDEADSPTSQTIASSSMDGMKAWNSGTECSVFEKDTPYQLGDFVVSNRQLYRRVNDGGGPAKVAPSHTKGAVTGSDGVTWFFVNPSFIQNTPRCVLDK